MIKNVPLEIIMYKIEKYKKYKHDCPVKETMKYNHNDISLEHRTP